MVGGFSRVVDLVQSEYGWSDKIVMNTPLARLRQIIANIEHRQRQERDLKASLLEWQTKTLASFIAATVPTDKGENKLLKEAGKISLKMHGEAETKPKELPSYEALMKQFGG